MEFGSLVAGPGTRPAYRYHSLLPSGGQDGVVRVGPSGGRVDVTFRESAHSLYFNFEGSKIHRIDVFFMD